MLYRKGNYTVHSLVWDSGMNTKTAWRNPQFLEPSWEKQIDSNCQEFQTWWEKPVLTVRGQSVLEQIIT